MAADGEVIVKIAADASKATLIAPAGLNREMFTVETLRLIVRQAGVLITPDVDQRLHDFVSSYADGSQELTSVVAESTPPVRGIDGFVEWAADLDPTAPPPTPPPPDGGPADSGPDGATPEGADSASGPGGGETVDETCDHYAARISTQVKSTEVVGRIHPPTHGEDGCNVLGRVINARPGRPAPYRFDDSLLVDALGNIIAQIDGILVCKRHDVSISQVLDVPGDVDFSVGRIDFTGSATIAGAVRPGFDIKVSDNLTVKRLIEGTSIHCGGNLVASGGMVGQGRGQITIGGNAHFSYIDGVKGVVTGDLTVDREIIDCNIATGKDLRCPNGNIIGGNLVITGSLIVKVLGSEGWTPTTISLGDVPLLRHVHRRVVRQVDAITARLAALAEQEHGLSVSRKLTHADKERLTELEFEISEARAELAAANARLAEIDTAIEHRRRIDVHISRALHPRVTLRIAETNACIRETIKGPIWIGRDADGQLAYRVGRGEAYPLARIADITHSVAEAA
ncbi:MAG: DUF342 domain-containing protein [Phycisphaerales bacterium]|nr:DUF342 domain-containing protein [Phycisphaerales bacterium]